MRKLLALIIAVLYMSFNACFAFSEMYYLKNTTVDRVKYAVSESYNSYDFVLKKSNPYYGVQRYDSTDYAVVILQQTGNNVFYYYQANNNKKINKNILKLVKKEGVDYELSENPNVLSVYDRLAQDIMSGNTTNRYTFEEPKPQQNVYYQNNYNNYNNQTYAQQGPQDTTLRGAVAQLSSGTTLHVYLQSAINTASANKGDQVIAVLMKDITYNGAVVFPQGSLIYGTLTKAVHASYGSRNGKVVIDFTQLVTPENKSYKITTEKVDFSVTNDGKLKSVATNAAVGAVVGALTGLLFAALAGKDIGTAAAIGAGVGAGGAVIGSTVERGVDAEIPSFTEMDLTLTKPLKVTVMY